MGGDVAGKTKQKISAERVDYTQNVTNASDSMHVLVEPTSLPTSSEP